MKRKKQQKKKQHQQQKKKKQHQQQQQKNSLINLLEEVLINRILLKLDTKSLGKLRCVCIYLYSYIRSPDFLKVYHHDRFNNNPLVLLVSGNKSLFYSLNFNGTHVNPCCPENVNIASGPLPQFPRFSDKSSSPNSLQHPLFFGSCNGLLCLVERQNSPPSLWNPTTKEYKKLPPPFSRSPRTETPFSRHNIIFGYTRVVAYGIGYDSIIDDYKVILCENTLCRRYIPPAGPGDITEHAITNFQVYTLRAYKWRGTSDTWRRIKDNPYKSYFKTPYHYKTPGMFVNGALHWILREKKSFGSKIIAFDIEKEIFRAEVPKPHSKLSDSSCNWSLHVLKGCLCIYERHDHRKCSHGIDVWMMKDYGVIESWTKLLTINDYITFASPDLGFKVLKFCENGKVIVARDYKSLQGLTVYDPIRRKFQPINIGEKIPGGISYKEIHIESLVPLNTGIYKGYPMINLPEDVLICRILLKLDTKSLMKLKCVCKYLRSLITSPTFAC